MSTAALAQISETALSLDEHLAAVCCPSAGAVATFTGQVRDHDPDARGTVVALEYTAHPGAESVLTRIASEAGGPETTVAVSHRVGRLGVGEAAVMIAVAAPHRDTAFTVCRAVIETIKTDLPVWKRQLEADGTASWKGVGG